MFSRQIRPGTDSKMPTRKNNKAAGIDLFAPHQVIIPAGGRGAVEIGFEVILPRGHFGHIVDSSANALNRGFHVMAGVIDEDYLGGIIVVLQNMNIHDDIVIAKHDKIAQLIVQPYNDGSPALMPLGFKLYMNIDSSRNRSGFGLTDANQVVQSPPQTVARNSTCNSGNE